MTVLLLRTTLVASEVGGCQLGTTRAAQQDHVDVFIHVVLSEVHAI